MLPNPSMQGPMGSTPGAAPGGGGGTPDEIRAQLVMLLKKAKEMAEKSGVNFSEVVAEVEGNKSRPNVPLPGSPPAASGM